MTPETARLGIRASSRTAASSSCITVERAASELNEQQSSFNESQRQRQVICTRDWREIPSGTRADLMNKFSREHKWEGFKLWRRLAVPWPAPVPWENAQEPLTGSEELSPAWPSETAAEFAGSAGGPRFYVGPTCCQAGSWLACNCVAYQRKNRDKNRAGSAQLFSLCQVLLSQGDTSTTSRRSL